MIGAYDVTDSRCCMVAADSDLELEYGGGRKKDCNWFVFPGTKQRENPDGLGGQCVTKFLRKNRQYKRYPPGCSFNPSKKRGTKKGSLLWNGAGGAFPPPPFYAEPGETPWLWLLGNQKTAKKGNKHYRPICCSREDCGLLEGGLPYCTGKGSGRRLNLDSRFAVALS